MSRRSQGLPRFALSLCLILGGVGCQTFNVRSDWDPAIRFASFQEYFWVEPPEREDASPFADNTLLRKRVRFAIEDALAHRGFRPSEDRARTDFLVTYSVILEERVRVNSISGTGGVYRGNFGGFGHIHSTASVRAYQESTLIIDFLNSDNDDLVWRGWGSGIVRTRDRGRGRGRGRDRLAKGVRAILDRFPPHEDPVDAD